ncbi:MULTISPECIES: transcriptional repressor LexA [Tissierella]|uniref:LexA repressor n=1 Tax=Tissierella praeacuta DSM 18095 TaxID=1123404 RepID=A0A1M4SGW3_9FIRM|nr:MULTISPECIES: transcriptional repressor LexA [Tissierella]MBU5254825.1 transcriptional repressor LexA [Tissierella praeacuta]TCU72723.1 SOS-response transcriptional repressor LexA [Tissierella praeacuta]SHE31436.1 SOS-response transcriptional repressor, LexA [Tissierella praeacuta DSM 18095]SUP01416.1 LexA repressor [Tissierella praeacuta]
MYEDLTQKQIEILLYIKSEVQRQGYPPAVRDICKGVNLKSTSTVHSHLEKLESKGYIRKDPTKPRAIEILDRNDDFLLISKKTVDIPILGKVTAGTPILAVENIEDTYPVPLELVEGHDVFMLKIQGESMIDAGILDGDLVLVREQKSALNGDIVVALLEDEATVKRFFKEKDRIRLQPENQFMEPIYAKDVSILGKVIGLFRKM